MGKQERAGWGCLQGKGFEDCEYEARNGWEDGRHYDCLYMKGGKGFGRDRDEVGSAIDYVTGILFLYLTWYGLNDKIR